MPGLARGRGCSVSWRGFADWEPVKRPSSSVDVDGQDGLVTLTLTCRTCGDVTFRLCRHHAEQVVSVVQDSADLRIYASHGDLSHQLVVVRGVE